MALSEHNLKVDLPCEFTMSREVFPQIKYISNKRMNQRNFFLSRKVAESSRKMREKKVKETKREK